MNIQIRAYQSKDAASAAQIWNEAVTDGNAFPQDTFFRNTVYQMTEKPRIFTGYFFRNRLIPVLQKMRTLTKFLAFISFILIMLEDVGTSVMPAMLSVKISVDCI